MAYTGCPGNIYKEEEEKMRVTYHSISGIGTFEDPYYCTSSKQEAKDCPVCVSRIPALREAMKNAQNVQARSPISD